MKKYALLFLMVLISITSQAFETNSTFGIEQQKDVNSYQQYIGHDFTLRKAIGQLETWKRTGIDPDESMFKNIYTVTKITVTDITLNDKPNREVLVEAVLKGGKKKIKFKGYEEVSVKVSLWSVKQYPLIAYMPIVFVEPYERFKEQEIGSKVINDLVKDKYEIIDVLIGKGSFDTTASCLMKIRNIRTNETFIYDKASFKVDVFKSALEGNYKTALIRVEKPEDSSNRYGESKTITDQGIDKYSYIDNIIDILIFGTTEQFNFILKNVSNNSIKVVWNEAAFVGLDGSSSKIMHVGTKYSEREGNQPATTIIKGAKIDDCATPTTNIYYDKGTTIGYTTIGNGWKTKSMLPSSHLGKEAGEIRLMLPIQVKDVINEYIFVFKVYYTYKHPELLNIDKI